MAADKLHGQRVAGVTPSDGVVAVGAGGYVGSRDKVQRVSKKLFKRSEVAVIGQSEGNAEGFSACHFKVRWHSLRFCCCPRAHIKSFSVSYAATMVRFTAPSILIKLLALDAADLDDWLSSKFPCYYTTAHSSFTHPMTFALASSGFVVDCNGCDRT